MTPCRDPCENSLHGFPPPSPSDSLRSPPGTSPNKGGRERAIASLTLGAVVSKHLNMQSRGISDAAMLGVGVLAALLRSSSYEGSSTGSRLGFRVAEAMALVAASQARFAILGPCAGSPS